MFDYYYYLLNVTADPAAEEPSGLMVILPPRRADRKRAGDVFFALLSLEGNLPLTGSQQNGLIEKAAEIYFTAGGSTTAAMRAAVEPINEFLYARNSRSSSEGKQATAQLNLGVLHGNTAFIAHAGTTHTLLLSKTRVEDYTDPAAGRGLGLSRSVTLRFYTETLEPGDVMLFSPKPAASWTPATLAGAPQLNRDILRRRLLNQVSGELRAGVIHFQPGRGEIHPLRLKTSSQSPVPAPATPPGQVPQAARNMATPIQSVNESASAVPVTRAATAPVVAEPASVPQTQASIPTMARPSAAGVEPVVHSTPILPKRPRRSGFQAALAAIFKRGRGAKQQMDGGLRRFAGRILPESGEQLPKLSTSSLLLIAIAIPVLIVALATTVYIRSGRDEQHKALLYFVQQNSDQAANAVSAQDKKTAWLSVLTQLDEAEKYGRSPESQQMRQQAQQAIDQIDGVRRLAYVPAMAGGFDNQVQITQLVSAQSGDLFALDSLTGRVLRLEYTPNGYILDRTFNCGPNQIGSLIVEPIVDIVALPRSNPSNADVLGIDAKGTLIFCRHNATTSADAVILAADSSWGKITAINLYDNSLYVLDPTNNVVWRYDSLYDNFSERPHKIDITVQNLFNTIDLAMYEDDLFLLHADGTTTKCSYRSQAYSNEMICTEPAPYTITDMDRNRQTMNIIENTQFSQIQNTYPLEPSVYILDQSNGAVFRFSVALQMQYQMRPSLWNNVALPAIPATAFTVTPAQEVIIVFSNQLFRASLPQP